MVAIPNEEQNNNNNKMESDEKVPLSLSLTTVSEANDVAHFSETDLLVMLTVKAPHFEPEDKRAPIQMSAVIDVSGSMHGEKLDLVKQATLFVSDQLNENDSLSLVLYNESASVPFALSKMDKANKERLLTTVNNMKAGGGTNISVGLNRGLNQLKSGGEKRGNDVVVSTLLFTDGQANSGARDAQGIYKSATDELGSLGSTINTFGFGSDHDANMLNELAMKGEGAYFYIKGPKDIGASFANCLGGLTSVFAQSIEVKAEALNGCTILESFTKFNETRDANGAWRQIQMKDVQSEEQKDIIFRIRVPAIKEENKDSFQAVKFTLSYINVLTKEKENFSSSVVIKRSSNPEPQTRPYDLDIEYNRVSVAKALDEATSKADRGDLAGARTVLQGAIELLNHSVTANDPKNQGLKVDLEKAVKAMESRQSYAFGGQQMMQTNSNSHWQQRQTSYSDQGQERYKSKAKASMMSKVRF